MNLEREQRARTLFLTASELPPAERDAFLDRECGEDELLRRCVDDLLRFSREGKLLPRSNTRGYCTGEFQALKHPLPALQRYLPLSPLSPSFGCMRWLVPFVRGSLHEEAVKRNIGSRRKLFYKKTPRNRGKPT